jgi:hypothetical protein
MPEKRGFEKRVMIILLTERARFSQKTGYFHRA